MTAPAPTQLIMGPAEWAMLIGLSLVWGGSFFFVGVAVADMPTLSIVALRVGIAALALWGYVLLSGRKVPRAPGVWIAFLGMGCLNNVIPFTLIVWGQQSIGSGLASILNATTPIFTVLVAGALLADERISAGKIAGVVLGFAGVAVMIGGDAMAGLGVGVLAQLAILAAALSYAFAGVYGRRFKSLGVDPVVTAAGQVTASSLVLVPLAIAIDPPLDASAASWLAILGLALISTAFAYVLYFRILERAGATNLLLVTFLIPVSAILLGALFLAESLTLTQLAGMALIAAGLAAIDGRLFRRKPSG